MRLLRCVRASQNLVSGHRKVEPIPPGHHGAYCSNTTYFLPVGDWYLLGILNSKATWFALGGISIPFGERAGEYRYRLFSQYIDRLPVPIPSDSDRQGLATVAEQCNSTGQNLYAAQEASGVASVPPSGKPPMARRWAT